jgi:signal transduction histidine kinase
MNYMGRLVWTEYFVTIATTAWIIYVSIAFGSELGTQNYLIIALVAWSIFHTNNTLKYIVITGIIIVAVLVNLYQRYYQPLFPVPEAVDLLFILNVITPLTVIAFMCRDVLKEAALAQHTIEQQKMDLEESNKFKDKVFSIIGHDLRAPFNSAKSLVDLLENDLLTKEERTVVLHELRAGVEVSLQTLDNILGWASQGYYGSILNVKTKVEPLNIRKLADKMMLLYNHLSAQKNVRFINNVEDNVHVAADLEQISFVLRNITSNALKFSHQGGAITYSTETNKETVIISVKDEGTGMTPDMIASLFKITTRFSKEGTTNEKGSGLGLIFCKEFVENNNGKLWLESEPGNGTTVLISLPKA